MKKLLTIFAMLFVLVGCNQDTIDSKDYPSDKMIIGYVKDRRANLCYLEYQSAHLFYAYTCVPCTKQVEKNLIGFLDK